MVPEAHQFAAILRQIKFTSQVLGHKARSPTIEVLLMTLPIGAYGLLVAMFGLIAIGSGIWLVVRARDVARLADTPDSDVVAGRTRRPPAGRRTTRAVLIIAIVSTIAALGIFALVATRTIDSDATQTNAYVQRP